MPRTPDEPTRRRFLAGLGLGSAATILTGGASLAHPDALGALISGTTVSTFTEPEVLASANGLLEVTLRAEPALVPYEGGARYALAYNGSVPGATLRLRPGDRLVIRLENRLDQPTNLHTHGLHVSPKPGADDVFVEIAPGGDHTYTYDLPADHPAGLFWYHAHMHPYVAEQVGAGLAGAIVVTDAPRGSAAAAPPALTDARERLWVLADPRIGETSLVRRTTMADRMLGREGDAILVNGVRRPRVNVRAGRLERWRLLNASSSRYYRLRLDAHLLHQIASDHGLLEAPHPVRELLLAPGERADVLVAPAAAGRFHLRSLAYDRGSPMGPGRGPQAAAATDAVVATMVVNGEAAAARPPSTLPGRSADVPAASRTRVVDLGMAMGPGAGGGGGPGMGGMAGERFTINGLTFDAARTDVNPSLGTVEEWVLRNATDMDHPIHLHTWPFRVVHRSGGGEPEPGWKDTVNVPAGQEVRIRIPFVGFAGRTVYHCHILDHEDLGMMATVEVT